MGIARSAVSLVGNRRYFPLAGPVYVDVVVYGHTLEEGVALGGLYLQ